MTRPAASPAKARSGKLAPKAEPVSPVLAHVSGTELARRFGVSQQTICDLANRGVIFRHQSGYGWPLSLWLYARYLQGVAAGRRGEGI